MEKVIPNIQSDTENFNLKDDDRAEKVRRKSYSEESVERSAIIRLKQLNNPVSDLRNEILNLEEYSLHINSNICKYISLDETNY